MAEEEKKEDQNTNFSFIHEKRKDKPLNKRRMFIQAIYTIVLAVLFGLVACVVFLCAKPYLEEKMNPTEEQKIIIPPDEEESEETQTETRTEETDQAGTETVYIPQMQELEPESYQALERKLYMIGEGAESSLVTVTGIKSGTDWFNAVYSSEDRKTGLIVANTGNELLILTTYDVVSEAESIRVTLNNGSMADAALRSYDSTTGLTVLEVPVDSFEEEDLLSVSVATLGNSLGISKGTVVLAVGTLLGSSQTVLPGNIIATDSTFGVADANYKVFETDITGSGSGNGVLINLQGEVIGLVTSEIGASDSNLSAISISDIKTLIEILSNGDTKPYVGLHVSNITEEIAEEYDLPTGVYVNSVAMDSPAMSAGIFSGDIIKEIDGKQISTVKEYMNAVMECEIEETIRIVVERQGNDGYSKVSIQVTTEALE